MARKKAVPQNNGRITQHDVANSFKRLIVAKNDEQKEMLSVISQTEISFIKGAPGTGKTFLAVGYALGQLLKGNYEKLIFTRPVVEAGGEKLGFLPGDMNDKIDPYMIPIFDAMSQLLPEEIQKQLIVARNPTSQIQVLPLAYMRGITFRNAFVICDEMQNATPEQIRMVLSRIGENSKIIVAGDVRQSDIMKENGLADAFDLLQGIEGVGFAVLTRKAIVRNPIIEKIEERYDERHDERQRKRMLHKNGV